LLEEQNGIKDDSADFVASILPNPVPNNFTSIANFNYKCENEKCKNIITQKELFLHFSIDLPDTKDCKKPISLQQVLKHTFDSETVEHTCGKCGHKSSSKNIRITKLSRILVLHLKRFQKNPETELYGKKKDFVFPNKQINLDFCCDPKASTPTTQQFYTDIDVKSFNETDEDAQFRKALELSEREVNLEQTNLDKAIENSLKASEFGFDFDEIEEINVDFDHEQKEINAKNKTFRYHLVSIVNHQGLTGLTGHYICLVRDCMTNTWKRFNDSVVYEISEQTALNSETQCDGYLFFYIHDNCFNNVKLPQ